MPGFLLRAVRAKWHTCIERNSRPSARASPSKSFAWATVRTVAGSFSWEGASAWSATLRTTKPHFTAEIKTVWKNWWMYWTVRRDNPSFNLSEYSFCKWSARSADSFTFPNAGSYAFSYSGKTKSSGALKCAPLYPRNTYRKTWKPYRYRPLGIFRSCSALRCSRSHFLTSVWVLAFLVFFLPLGKGQLADPAVQLFVKPDCPFTFSSSFGHTLLPFSTSQAVKSAIVGEYPKHPFYVYQSISRSDWPGIPQFLLYFRTLYIFSHRIRHTPDTC